MAIDDQAAPLKPSLSMRQTGVAIGMGLAVISTMVLFWLGLRPFGAGDTADRLLVFATALIGPLVSLVIAVGLVANRRFFSPDDIDAAATPNPESHGIRLLRAILGNTLEQAVLAIGAYAMLAILLPANHLALPIALAAAFLKGRLAFALGYRFGAPARALGFGLTFYPTLCALAYAALLALSKVPGALL